MAFAGDLPKLPRGSRDAETIIRPFFDELKQRIDPLSLVDYFYKNEIVEMGVKERIDAIEKSEGRLKAANEFLKVMVRASWEHGITLAQLLMKTGYLRDLGQNMLFTAGRLLEQSRYYYIRVSIETCVEKNGMNLSIYRLGC